MIFGSWDNDIYASARLATRQSEKRICEFWLLANFLPGLFPTDQQLAQVAAGASKRSKASGEPSN